MWRCFPEKPHNLEKINFVDIDCEYCGHNLGNQIGSFIADNNKNLGKADLCEECVYFSLVKILQSPDF